MIEHQLSGCRGVAIPFLGDGQGNNGDLRIAQRRQHGFKAVDLRMQRIFDDADHARRPRIGRHLCYGIKIILCLQIGDLLFAANQVNFAVTPVAALFCGEYIGVHRLVRTVKRAKP